MMTSDAIVDTQVKINRLTELLEMLKVHSKAIVNDRKKTYFKSGPQMYNDLLIEKTSKILEYMNQAVVFNSEEMLKGKNLR